MRDYIHVVHLMMASGDGGDPFLPPSQVEKAKEAIAFLSSLSLPGHSRGQGTTNDPSSSRGQGITNDPSSSRGQGTTNGSAQCPTGVFSVRACVRACVCVCVCLYACISVCVSSRARRMCACECVWCYVFV